MTLDEIFNKFTTDKGTAFHAYYRAYEPLLNPLQRTEGKLLELGVRTGDSIQSWAEFLTRFTVVGMDILTEYKYPPHERITILKGDSTSERDLFTASALGPYDIIIDDASHQANDIEIAFRYLFRHALKSGGAYVIEDLHSQYLEEFRHRNQNPRGAMDFLYSLVDTHNWSGKSQSGDPSKEAHHALDWWEKAIGSIEFHKGIVVVRKR